MNHQDAEVGKKTVKTGNRKKICFIFAPFAASRFAFSNACATFRRLFYELIGCKMSGAGKPVNLLKVFARLGEARS
jgi:hypothetical protein